jgi:D-arabinose 1-dehydrogenase-like Zn-dependent alcohol dehydrogenase
LLRRGARYVTAGLVLPSTPVEIDASALVRGMLTLRGIHNHDARHLARALDFAARRRDDGSLGSLVEFQVPLDAIDEAFALAAGRRSVRVGIIHRAGRRRRVRSAWRPRGGSERVRRAARRREGFTV